MCPRFDFWRIGPGVLQQWTDHGWDDGCTRKSDCKVVGDIYYGRAYHLGLRIDLDSGAYVETSPGTGQSGRTWRGQCRQINGDPSQYE